MSTAAAAGDVADPPRPGAAMLVGADSVDVSGEHVEDCEIQMRIALAKQ